MIDHTLLWLAGLKVLCSGITFSKQCSKGMLLLTIESLRVPGTLLKQLLKAVGIVSGSVVTSPSIIIEPEFNVYYFHIGYYFFQIFYFFLETSILDFQYNFHEHSSQFIERIVVTFIFSLTREGMSSVYSVQYVIVVLRDK